MMRYSSFFFGLMLAGCGWLRAAEPARPNLVIILADDMGYSDLGCFGSEIPTPNLDALAQNGLRFTQFYNTARCLPTRAALLTGLHPHQAGMGRLAEEVVGTKVNRADGYLGYLNNHCVTLAEFAMNICQRNIFFIRHRRSQLGFIERHA